MAGNLYTIQDGDTLFTIAQQQCGDGSLFMALAALNNIADPDVIYAGTNITIDCDALRAWNPGTPPAGMPGPNPDGTYG